MGELVSVQNDPNSHGEGRLTASNNPGKVFVQGKLVNLQDSVAAPDNLDHLPGQTDASGHSNKVFVGGIPVHRNNDSRYCGAVTIVEGNTKVFAG